MSDSIGGFQRHVQDRGDNTKAELAKRTTAVNALAEKYPRISAFYFELLYDWLHEMTDEQRTAAINNDTDIPRPQVGEVECGMEILKARSNELTCEE